MQRPPSNASPYMNGYSQPPLNVNPYASVGPQQQHSPAMLAALATRQQQLQQQQQSQQSYPNFSQQQGPQQAQQGFNPTAFQRNPGMQAQANQQSQFVNPSQLLGAGASQSMNYANDNPSQFQSSNPALPNQSMLHAKNLANQQALQAQAAQRQHQMIGNPSNIPPNGGMGLGVANMGQQAQFQALQALREQQQMQQSHALAQAQAQAQAHNPMGINPQQMHFQTQNQHQQQPQPRPPSVAGSSHSHSSFDASVGQSQQRPPSSHGQVNQNQSSHHTPQLSQLALQQHQRMMPPPQARPPTRPNTISHPSQSSQMQQTQIPLSNVPGRPPTAPSNMNANNASMMIGINGGQNQAAQNQTQPGAGFSGVGVNGYYPHLSQQAQASQTHQLQRQNSAGSLQMRQPSQPPVTQQQIQQQPQARPPSSLQGANQSIHQQPQSGIPQSQHSQPPSQGPGSDAAKRKPDSPRAPVIPPPIGFSVSGSTNLGGGMNAMMGIKNAFQNPSAQAAGILAANAGMGWSGANKSTPVVPGAGPAGTNAVSTPASLSNAPGPAGIGALGVTLGPNPGMGVGNISSMAAAQQRQLTMAQAQDRAHQQQQLLQQQSAQLQQLSKGGDVTKPSLAAHTGPSGMGGMGSVGPSVGDIPLPSVGSGVAGSSSIPNLPNIVPPSAVTNAAMPSSSTLLSGNSSTGNLVPNPSMSSGPGALSRTMTGSGPGPAFPPPGTYDPNRTRITDVPLNRSGTLIPPLSPRSISELKEVMAVDRDYEAGYKEMKDRMRRELLTCLGGELGPKWWEEDAALKAKHERDGSKKEKFGILWPADKRKQRERKLKKFGRKEVFRLERKLSEKDANVPEMLVPIRLEFDVDQHRFKETFVWNLNDPSITPEIYAQSIVDDFALPSQFVSLAARLIGEQLSDFKSHTLDDALPFVSSANGEGDFVHGALGEEDVEWWEGWRKRLRTEDGFVKIGKSGRKKKIMNGNESDKEILPELDEVGGEDRMNVDTATESDAGVDHELRVLIKLDVVVGTMKLDDQFEWDVGEENNSPERFAEVYANELGLSGEFTTAIAHSIREQVHAYQKSLFLVGHTLGSSAIQDADLKDAFLPTLSPGYVARSVEQARSYTPLLNPVDEIDLAVGAEKEKNRKRKMRQTGRRRAVMLPDRDVTRTHRTPAIGFQDIDPGLSSLLGNTPAPTSRRAAAAAASLNIANMVASENGGVVMPVPDRPAPPPPPPNKATSKVRGLFKAPEYSASVLRPRARIPGAIESTATDYEPVRPPVSKAETDDDNNASGFNSERKSNKAPSAKRLKEIEREEKEKEYAKRQHPNMIDGVWHCSNCGCPESIAVGRRKGPLGDKSQCGDCGKYYHRYRKPREVVYSPDLEHHLALKREGTSSKKRGGGSSRAHNAASEVLSRDTPMADDLSPPPPGTPGPENSELPDSFEASEMPEGELQEREHETLPKVEAAPSPPLSSSRGSSSEPLAVQVGPRANGQNAPPPPDPVPGLERRLSDLSPSTPSRIMSTGPSAESPTRPSHKRPQWLINAVEVMQGRYPDDRFDVIARKTADPEAPPEWRLKCLDCPGKLYTPGPEETLNNFEVHLKNRLHRKRVIERVQPESVLTS
ncbi:SNF5-domain-containing protein [Sistotremastrum suecicum HHB10207 ss-3]|uniref:SNF5-domain-containing protein n=1 Tax=Sistotremastrum suecicum HHB10207 ss-3 TaxID=1314776 RepID=A0A166I3R6_9AGAM|nr:SNF5-domain-containing protein [Sistotremastrum suecicum HHB10207 ss-3]